MKIKKIKFNELVSNWNLINILIGYPFITILFSPLLGGVAETTILTIPYRAFSLFLAVLVLFLNFNKKIKKPFALKLFIFFWFLVLLRMFFDLEIQTEYLILKEYKQRLWLFSIGIIIIPMFSVIKSINIIEFNYLQKWIYRLGIFFLLISFFNVVQDSSVTERIEGSKALDSISFGKTAILISILAFYNILKTIKQRKFFILHIVIFLFGIYIGLRSGSRGPILAFSIVILFWFSFKNNISLIKGSILFLFMFVLMLASQQYLLTLIHRVSPVTASRIQLAITGDDLSTINRLESYSWFIKEIKESPIWGSHFARLESGQFPGYAHNIFLDILLAFGFIGLFIVLFVLFKALQNCYFSLKEDSHFWIGFSFLLFLILSITSGAYYTNPDLNITLVLTLLFFKKDSHEN